MAVGLDVSERRDDSRDRCNIVYAQLVAASALMDNLYGHTEAQTRALQRLHSLLNDAKMAAAEYVGLRESDMTGER